MVATRMRDTALKRVLKVMPVGTAVQMEGPAGDLTLHNDAARTAVFLCGGIGITPFPEHRLRRGQRTSPSPDFPFLARTGGRRMRPSSQNCRRWRGRIPTTSSSRA